MERTFRQALTDPNIRNEIREALGWDDSQVSRFLSGQMGLTIDKIDAAIDVLSMRVVSRRYLDAMTELAGTGVKCWCAREGLGDCGGMS
nr:DNA-binding protein [Pigmentiphaga kullae]